MKSVVEIKENKYLKKNLNLVSINIDDANESTKKKVPFEILLKEISKKLMGYARVLVKNNEDDAWDLIQITILKIMEKKEVFMKSDYKTAFAKTVLKNSFIDKYRKDKKMVSVEANSIQLAEPGKLQEAREFEEMLTFLESMDDEDQTILAMLALGHSYQEIQEVLGPISIGNLRVKANRARIRLAESMEREHE